MLVSVKEIIFKSFSLARKDFSIFLPYLIVNVIISFISSFFSVSLAVIPFLSNLGFPVLVMLTLTLLVVFGVILVGVWVNTGLMRVIQSRLAGQAALSFRQALSETRHIIARAIGVSILVSIIIFVPLLLSIVGFTITGFWQLFLKESVSGNSWYILFGVIGVYGIFHFIYFSIRYGLSYYSVVLDNAHIREALQRSHTLTQGRMPAMFWRLLAPVLTFLMIGVIANPFLNAIVDRWNNSILFILVMFISLIVSSCITLLIFIALITLYKSAQQNPVPLKAEKE